MKWSPAGQDHLVSLPFKNNDREFVIPSAATFSLKAADGTAIRSGSLTTGATQTTLVVLASETSVASDDLYKVLILSIQYIVDGEPFQRFMTLGFVPFTPIIFGPDEVRAELGVRPEELSDAEIDLFMAYTALFDEYGDRFRTVCLTGSIDAGMAIVLKAALDIVPSMTTRIMQSVKAEDHQNNRFSKVDLEVLAEELRSKLSLRLNRALGLVATTLSHFRVAAPTTDPLTGA